MKSFLAYKLTCAGCSSSYIGETYRHFKNWVEEHIRKNNKSHISKHLHSTPSCFDLYNSLCFKIIDKAYYKFDLKIKEASHINWRKPKFKCSTKWFSFHPFTIASLLLAPFCLFFFVCVCFSFIILFIISTLIIEIFYCPN